jgi:N-hydroxyarylamine O-acetyltransferase
MDLNSYLNRIGLEGQVKPDLETLKRLHLSHATRIPFENLDIQLGKTISLELEDLQGKMIHRQRGGYCFEQNTLMHAALTEMGFDVIACEARVRMGRSMINPRTHMLLVVSLANQRYLVDVGFGGDGLLLPVSLSGEEERQFLWTYRTVQEGESFVLQTKRNEGWFDLYVFDPAPRYPVDFQVANWYTSSHPESKFVQTLTVQLPTPEARLILRNRSFITERGGVEEVQEIVTRQQLMQILDRTFGLSFPADTHFRNPRF